MDSAIVLGGCSGLSRSMDALVELLDKSSATDGAKGEKASSNSSSVRWLAFWAAIASADRVCSLLRNCLPLGFD